MPLSLTWREQGLSNSEVNTGTFQSVDIFYCVSETNSYKPDFRKALHVNWETYLHFCSCSEGLSSSDLGSVPLQLIFVINVRHILKQNLASAVCDWLWAGFPSGRSSNIGAVKNFSIFHVVQTYSAAELAYFPVGTGALYLGTKRPGREANTHLQLALRSRKRLSIYLLIHATS
jgi:hypothetical protein